MLFFVQGVENDSVIPRGLMSEEFSFCLFLQRVQIVIYEP